MMVILALTLRSCDVLDIGMKDKMNHCDNPNPNPNRPQRCERLLPRLKCSRASKTFPWNTQQPTQLPRESLAESYKQSEIISVFINQGNDSCRRYMRIGRFLPDVLVSLDVETVEVIVFDQPLLRLFIFAFTAFHYGQLHLHRNIHRQYRLQQILLKHTHKQVTCGGK